MLARGVLLLLQHQVLVLLCLQLQLEVPNLSLLLEVPLRLGLRVPVPVIVVSERPSLPVIFIPPGGRCNGHKKAYEREGEQLAHDLFLPRLGLLNLTPRFYRARHCAVHSRQYLFDWQGMREKDGAEGQN